jgi:hypothetical protein
MATAEPGVCGSYWVIQNNDWYLGRETDCKGLYLSAGQDLPQGVRTWACLSLPC